MNARFRRFLPDRERIQSNRWLRWLGPGLMHPRLWHFSRRGVAVGVSLGVFFGLLIPIAQIPFAAGAAVLLRANVPAAVASTLVTNPVTFAPIYLAAHRLGSALLGEPETAAGQVPTAPAVSNAPSSEASPVEAAWWRGVWQGILALGKPLLLGLSILAICAGLLAYGLIMLAWRARVVWQRRRRRRA
ncbi:DUF2062 domain-containing protein [Quisquiliibacterium transsilvanicum]|uniref:DUF2062 domain-containing protein n=1 Tax=Quisquiliibacterium transsilvanicum TaxID=1549638 RepID=A0A7W8HE64_9BURK|nr:DUF2062 domain-containing protein [Quisquiliibacterium transsilvanicum]MBB5270305.1 hypothetical protein [Quisquiliibacterium transsilvanicum]